MNLRDTARKLKREIPALAIALKHPETPLRAKLLALLTVGYALSPIDLIPDFIPVLGYLDDLFLLPLLVALTLKAIPPQLMETCRKEAEGTWANGKPKRWIYAIPVILLWFLLGWIILRLFTSAH